MENGDRQEMRRVGLLSIAFLLAGCASSPPVQPHERAATRQQAETVLQDLRREAATLRADLAATRIAAARQEAELQQLRWQVEELNRALSIQQLEFTSLRHERDRLLLTQNIHEDAGTTQAKLQEVESALTALTTEVSAVRRELAYEPASVHVNAIRVPDMPMFDEGRPAWVIVQTRESLWLLARRYKLTVEELKAANKLESDQIHVGQRLIIPPSLASSPLEEEDKR